MIEEGWELEEGEEEKMEEEEEKERVGEEGIEEGIFLGGRLSWFVGNQSITQILIISTPANPAA